MKNSLKDSKLRFSNRVKNYTKYRPTYPTDLIKWASKTLNLQQKIVADIGSGTGILTELILPYSHLTFGIEPNTEMRSEAEKMLNGNSQFFSLNASAEQTCLPKKSVDVIFAAQAFHWFDIEKTREEFKRILKPGGKVAIVWNDRITMGDEFSIAYENLLQTYGTDYKKVDHKMVDTNKIESFFGKGLLQKKSFANKQIFDYKGLKGRLLSSSYTPTSQDDNFKPMISELKNVFDKTNQNGFVSMKYSSNIYIGEFG